MSAIDIGPPPELVGSTEVQLVTMRRYLYMLSRDLNVALNNLTVDNFTPQAITALGSGETAKTAQSAAETYAALKSMIIKNATYVRSEIDRIEEKLSSNYYAKSEFGEYEKIIDTKITTQADAISIEIEKREALEADTSAALAVEQSYREMMSGYIKIGIIDDPDSAESELGIAMGSDVTLDENGKVTKSGYHTTYTTQGLAFWDGQQKIFWISNSLLHAGAIQVENTITQGSWQIDSVNGWTLRWTGE